VASDNGSGTLDPGSYDVSGAAFCDSTGVDTISERYSLTLTLTP
jgi:hypothetical protein